MKTTIPVLIILLVSMTTSCRNEQKVIEETWPDGSPKRICIYKGKGDNREMVRETVYYENHQIQMDGEYKDKKRTGKWTSWYENGKLWSEGFFKNGMAEGRRTTYFENGKVRYDGMYKEDQKIGKWRFYDEKGKILAEENYPAIVK